MNKCIEKLQATSSTNAKIALIIKCYEEHGETWIKTLQCAYDELKNFHVKKFNKSKTHLGTAGWDVMFSVLDKLATRKVTGKDAIELVEYTYKMLDSDKARVFAKILNKDLKCGINKKLIKKALINKIKFFEIGYMGAVTYDPKKVLKILENNIFIFSQEKMDGEYAHLKINFDENNDICNFKFYTRQNKRIHMPSQIVNRLANNLKHFTLSYDFPKNIILNGELIIAGYDRYTSNGLLTRIFKIADYIINKESEKKIKKALEIVENLGNNKIQNILNKIEYYVWDYQDPSKPYFERWRDLYKKQGGYARFTKFIKPVESWLLVNQAKLDDKYQDVSARNELINQLVTDKKLFFSETKAGFNILMKHFVQIASRDGEGTVVKAGSNNWKTGKPTDIVKVKKKFQCEMKIVDFKQGTHGTKYEDSLGALICESEDSKVKCDASGLTDNLRAEIWNNKDDYFNKIVTIECNALSRAKDSDHYRLLHPRFVAFRNDKDKADNLKTIREIYESSLKL